MEGLGVLFHGVGLIAKLSPPLNKLASERHRATDMRISFVTQRKAKGLRFNKDVGVTNLDDPGVLRLLHIGHNAFGWNRLFFPHFIDGKVTVPPKADQELCETVPPQLAAYEPEFSQQHIAAQRLGAVLDHRETPNV
jgi:hypothetical protein